VRRTQTGQISRRLNEIISAGSNEYMAGVSQPASHTKYRYKPPFDRHDWTIDRCGQQVEYIIDFYGGKGGMKDGKVSFYLDVRPKLTVEGGKMRIRRWIGDLLPQPRTTESSASNKTN
jgi:hypothetical protein